MELPTTRRLSTGAFVNDRRGDACVARIVASIHEGLPGNACVAPATNARDSERTREPIPSAERANNRSICYVCVSTDEQRESGLGLAAQEEKCAGYAKAMGYIPTSTVSDAGVSGTVAPDARPGLGQALADLDAGRADILIAASLSRIGRKVLDVVTLAERAERAGWSLVVLDLSLDTRSSVGKFCLAMLAAVAQLERDQISERTKAALGVKRAQGARLEHPVSEATRHAGRRTVELDAAAARAAA